MGNTLIQFNPKEGAEILLVLFLSDRFGAGRTKGGIGPVPIWRVRIPGQGDHDSGVIPIRIPKLM